MHIYNKEAWISAVQTQNGWLAYLTSEVLNGWVEDFN